MIRIADQIVELRAGLHAAKHSVGSIVLPELLVEGPLCALGSDAGVALTGQMIIL